MPGGNSLWWRAWVEAAHDPKLLGLPPSYRWYWFSLLCLAKASGGYLPARGAPARWLGVRQSRANQIIDKLHERRLLDLIGGRYVPHNWEARQYLEGSSTPRVRRFRKRLHGAFQETTPEQSRERKVEKKEAANGSKEARGSYLPQDWQPDERDLTYARGRGFAGDRLATEVEKFRNHFHGAAGQRARKRDWHAAWRNWLLNDRFSKPQPKQTEGFRW